MKRRTGLIILLCVLAAFTTGLALIHMITVVQRSKKLNEGGASPSEALLQYDPDATVKAEFLYYDKTCVMGTNGNGTEIVEVEQGTDGRYRVKHKFRSELIGSEQNELRNKMVTCFRYPDAQSEQFQNEIVVVVKFGSGTTPKDTNDAEYIEVPLVDGKLAEYLGINTSGKGMWYAITDADQEGFFVE